MGTTALSVLEQRLAEQIGDWIQEDTTTNIGANTSVVSTALNKWDGGANGYFDDWWIYIDGVANAGVERKTGKTTYATATGTLTVYGGNLAAESASVSFNMHRYERANYIRAFNDAIREIYPNLHQPMEDRELVVGNLLPPFNWTSATALQFYAASNGNLAKTTTAGNVRRAPTSCLLTTTAANGYLYMSSQTYPKLLDIQGKTISVKVWVKPEVANDATIVISAVSNDGTTTQTLTSTTACPAGYWTLLELEDQEINDDLKAVEIRFKVATNAKTCYFETPRVIGHNQMEYLLPYEFQGNDITRVYVQTAGYMDDICDDAVPRHWERVYGYSTYQQDIFGTKYEFLRLPYLYTTRRQIQLTGTKPLSTLSAATDTIEINGKEINLFIAYAKYRLFRIIQGSPASQDASRYQDAINNAWAEYSSLLSSLKMGRPAKAMKLPAYYRS